MQTEKNDLQLVANSEILHMNYCVMKYFLFIIWCFWIVYRAIIKNVFKTYILFKLNFIEINMEKTFIILKHICIFRYIHLPSVEY